VECLASRWGAAFGWARVWALAWGYEMALELSAPGWGRAWASPKESGSEGLLEARLGLGTEGPKGVELARGMEADSGLATGRMSALD